MHISKSSAPPTPLMQQYFSIKEKYPGAILLFRVGDFYETFLEDAKIASKVLDIVLTKRSNGAAASVELAGFPHHALDLYLPKLVKKGYRVAICDQLQDPKQAKGIVERGVTELVTPALSFQQIALEGKKNQYLASLYFGKKEVGIAFLDLSTGEFSLAEGNLPYVHNLLSSLAPAEIIYNKAQFALWQTLGQETTPSYGLNEWVFDLDYAHRLLKDHFGTTNLDGFGISCYSLGIISAGAIVRYLHDTEHKQLGHITTLKKIDTDSHLSLDGFTIQGLELITPQQADGTSLIEILDQTLTPMGSRLLKKWLLFPLKDSDEIQERLNIVEEIMSDQSLGEQLTLLLKKMHDVERLASKVATQRVNPREMVALKQTLERMAPIKAALSQSNQASLSALGNQLHDCQALHTRINQTLKEEPPMVTHQGGFIQSGISSQLDQLHTIIYEGKEHLLTLQEEERKKTGITSLKVGYNRVFGYYLEVPHTHKNKVPKTWIRKQTLTGAERYITEALKWYEETILNGTEKAQELEKEIYALLVQKVHQSIAYIQHNAKIVATLDCYLSFAQQAQKSNYCKPIIDQETSLILRGNRHPVIEATLPIKEHYVANDIHLDESDQQLIIITGPNMAGKSALLRQVALTVIMAQMGSFVPAKWAKIGVIDKIFIRVGAYDNLAKGASTFMVEMSETANIIHNLSQRSLVLMDEIGRGTSTYDGISIAWALVEYLHNHPNRAKTLFATHYHELNELEKYLPRVKNYNVAVKEIEGKILFLHQLIAGGSEHSFGIHVAKMSGIPEPILTRATEILTQLAQSTLKK